MKNIKRFEIDVETSFGGDEYSELYPLKIEDLGTPQREAAEGYAVAEITINGSDNATASFQVNLEDIDALFDVLNHVRNKVNEDKPQPKDEIIDGDKS